MKNKTIAPATLLAVFCCSCSPGPADYEERNDYLLEMAQRGVQINKLYQGQGQEITRELCEEANLALNDDIPTNRGWGREPTEEWRNLVKETFINACISGDY